MVGTMVGAALLFSSMGWWHDNTRLGRPIATAAAYPVGMADDVHRPGFNGRLHVTRPVIGGMQGPYATEASLLADRYGAFGDEYAVVYARVGSLVVGINAFEPITKNGLRRFEQARNFWLQEQGYTGGVRTFVNDAYLFRKADGSPRAESSAKPEPLATIKLPDDMPRRKNRLRVEATPPNTPAIAALAEGSARLSWPAAAPAEAVARTEAHGHIITLGQPAPMPVAAAR
ncbi:MAG: hypothetical protein KF678_07150 [Phycisphaeraceae bacterium]|nr:hypothetical protein [Phycisphaeraceae bacterium]